MSRLADMQVFYGIAGVGTAVDGTTGLQSAVPLVYGAFDTDEPGLGPDGVQKTATGCRAGEVFTKFMSQLLDLSAGPAAVVGRAFFGGRNIDRCVGLTEEHAVPQGRQRRR